MKVFKNFCCGCCGKDHKKELEQETEIEESVLMIEDPFTHTRLVEKVYEKEVKKAENEDKKILQARKPLKIKKKQIERINISGAVAALPPPPIEEIEGNIPKVKDNYDKLNLGNGVYLVYSLEDNGSLYLHYTNKKPTCMDGILGYIRPDKEILNYHYENNNGKHVISTNVKEYMKSKFQHDRKKYYDAWQEFLQILNSYGGSLYILSSFNLSPPPRTKIVLFSDNKLSEIELCKEININENELLGVFPFSLDYKSKLINGVNRKDFSEMCDKYGFVFKLIK